MALTFPNSPSNGQTYNYNGDTYVFDGKRWKSQAQSIDLTPFATDAELAAATSGLASTSYVDNAVAGAASADPYLTLSESGVTVASLPGSAPAGSVAYVTNDGGNLYYKNANSWKSITARLGSIDNPAPSASAIINAGDSIGDGVYYIQSASGAVATYCMMSWGGYMLVAKMDATQDANWAYTGSHWSASNPVNETSCQNVSSADALNRLFYEYPMEVGFRFSMDTVGNYLADTAGGTCAGYTAKQVFTGGSRSSDNGRAQFLALAAGAGVANSQFDNEPNCNHTGFNISGSQYAFRWGISMNNENDCASNDAGVAFGGYTNGQVTSSQGIRNANAGCWRWNPDQGFPKNGWIWVK